MARKNLLLTCSLLVMVGALIVGILISAPDEDPPGFGPGLAEQELEEIDPEAAEAAEADAAAERNAVATAPADSFAIRGRLRFESGRPAADVIVHYAAVESGVARDLPEALSTRTDADGRFGFATVPESDQTGRVVLDDEAQLLFQMTETMEFTVASSGKPVDLGDMLVVEACVIRGIAVDEFDRPVEGVKIEVRVLGALAPGRFETTPVDGRFQFGLRPGRHRISSASGEHMPVSVDVTVARGVIPDEVVLRLKAGASIEGVVLDDLGQPIEGAKVAAYRERRLDANTKVDGINTAEAVHTDTAGVFRLGGIERGETVRVRAWAEGHTAHVAASVASGSRDVRFELARNGSVKGIVVDASGEPIADSEISVVRDGAFEQMVIQNARPWRSGKDGRFLIDDVAPGTVQLRVQGANHRDVTHSDVVVRAGEPTSEIRIVAEVGAAIVATVLDSENRPVADARVRVSHVGAAAADGTDVRYERREVREVDGKREVTIETSSDVLGEGTTDGDGKVTIAGLPAGPVVVRAEHEDNAPGKPVQIVLPRVGEVEAHLTMRAGGFIDVLTVDADDAPKSGAAFLVRGPRSVGETPPSERHVADGTGKARIGPLLPGSYSIVLVHKNPAMQIGNGGTFVQLADDEPELEDSTVELEVLAGQSVAARLVFPILATVRGRVTDANGPARGVLVKLEPAGADAVHGFGQGRTGTTDADGAFSIAEVAPGDYTMTWGRRMAVVRHESAVTIPPGQRDVEKDLVLSGGSVRVVVSDVASGEALERASVALSRADHDGSPTRRRAGFVMMTLDVNAGEDGQMLTMESGGPGTVLTDEEGVATIEDVPPGTYSIVIRHKAHQDERVAEVVVRDQAETEVPPVALKAAGFLRGKVTGFSAESRVMFAMLEVQRVGDGGEPRRENAMNGSIRVNGLAPGSYRVRARAMGPDASEEYGPWVDAEIVTGERTRVQVPLK